MTDTHVPTDIDNTLASWRKSLRQGIGLRETTEKLSAIELATTLYPWKWVDYQREILIKLAETDWRRMVLLAPPRHRKTTIVSLFAAIFVGEDPNRRVMVASHTKDFAALLVNAIVEVMKSPIYQRSYGDLLPQSGSGSRWTMYEKHLPGRPVFVRDPTFLCLSPDSGTPGYGADLIVLDDIVTQANSQSPTMRKHISEWVRGSLLKRLEPDGKFLVVGNRFYPDDFYGEALKNDHWDRAIYTSTKEKPLWPERWDSEALEQAELDDPIFFHGQYRMDPIDVAARGTFNPDWFQYYVQEPNEMAVFAGVDLPIKKDFGTSKYSFCVLGRAANGIIYILDAYSDYHDANELPKLMDELFYTWRPHVVAWESNGPQEAVMELVKPLMSTSMNLLPRPSLISKELRLASIAGKVRSGKVLLPGEIKPSGTIVAKGIGKQILKAWGDHPAGDSDLLDGFEKAVSIASEGPPAASSRKKRTDQLTDEELERLEEKQRKMNARKVMKKLRGRSYQRVYR